MSVRDRHRYCSTVVVSMRESILDSSDIPADLEEVVRIATASDRTDILEEQIEGRDIPLEQLRLILSIATLEYLQNRLASSINKVERIVEEETENHDEERLENVLYHVFVFKDMLPFYTLYQNIIDHFSIQLLHDEHIIDTYEGSNSSYELFEDMSQPTREDLLKRTGVLNHQYTDEMRIIRRMRNDLVHDPTERHSGSSIKELAEKVDTAADLVIKLHEELDEESQLSVENIENKMSD